MRNLKTIENRVLAVLKEHPEARNDDMKLYLLVSKACIYDTHGISHFSFEDVMSNYKAYGIPCFESIRRTRQKIQAKYPELGCSPEVRRARHKMQRVYATGITQNVDDLLQSHTARTMLANSEFIIMLNQASTDRLELAKLLNISDLQMSYITNVEAGHGLIKVGSSLVPFANKFPKNTKLYKLMTTKPGESA